MKEPVIHVCLVIIGAAILLLLVWWINVHTPPVGCQELPEYRPSGQLSFSIAQEPNRSGFVCARIYNGTNEELGYGPTAFSLEKSWLWFVWLPYFNVKGVLKHFLLGTPTISVTPVLRHLPIGGKADGYLPFSYFGRYPAPSGRYRVCFHYYVRWPTEGHVCSMPFWLP